MMAFTVHTAYEFTGSFEMDDAASHAAQRTADFSGSDGCGRDLGWWCEGEVEAMRIKRALDKIGLHATIKEQASSKAGDTR